MYLYVRMSCTRPSARVLEIPLFCVLSRDTASKSRQYLLKAKHLHRVLLEFGLDLVLGFWPIVKYKF